MFVFVRDYIVGGWRGEMAKGQMYRIRVGQMSIENQRERQGVF